MFIFKIFVCFLVIFCSQCSIASEDYKGKLPLRNESIVGEIRDITQCMKPLSEIAETRLPEFVEILKNREFYCDFDIKNVRKELLKFFGSLFKSLSGDLTDQILEEIQQKIQTAYIEVCITGRKFDVSGALSRAYNTSWPMLTHPIAYWSLKKHTNRDNLPLKVEIFATNVWNCFLFGAHEIGHVLACAYMKVYKCDYVNEMSDFDSETISIMCEILAMIYALKNKELFGSENKKLLELSIKHLSAFRILSTTLSVESLTIAQYLFGEKDRFLIAPQGVQQFVYNRHIERQSVTEIISDTTESETLTVDETSCNRIGELKKRYESFKDIMLELIPYLNEPILANFLNEYEMPWIECAFHNPSSFFTELNLKKNRGVHFVTSKQLSFDLNNSRNDVEWSICDEYAIGLVKALLVLKDTKKQDFEYFFSSDTRISMEAINRLITGEVDIDRDSFSDAFDFLKDPLRYLAPYVENTTKPRDDEDHTS